MRGFVCSLGKPHCAAFAVETPASQSHRGVKITAVYRVSQLALSSNNYVQETNSWLDGLHTHLNQDLDISMALFDKDKIFYRAYLERAKFNLLNPSQLKTYQTICIAAITRNIDGLAFSCIYTLNPKNTHHAATLKYLFKTAIKHHGVKSTKATINNFIINLNTNAVTKQSWLQLIQEIQTENKHKILKCCKKIASKLTLCFAGQHQQTIHSHQTRTP